MSASPDSGDGLLHGLLFFSAMALMLYKTFENKRARAFISAAVRDAALSQKAGKTLIIFIVGQYCRKYS
jgi:hypothetical protein